MQRAAARKFNRAERTGDAAQLAAHAQALVQLHSAIDTGDGIHRTDARTGGILTLMAELRGRLFFITHNAQARHGLQPVQAVCFRTRRFTGVAANTDRRVSNYKTVHRGVLRT
ncbi:hypothetical protein D3C76_1456660 [compost metagenome]